MYVLQKAAFSKKKAVLTTKMGFKLRRKLAKYIWSVAFYGDGEGRRSLDQRVKEEVLLKAKEKKISHRRKH